MSSYFLSNYTSTSNVTAQTGAFPTFPEQSFASTTGQNLPLTPSEILNLDLSSLRTSYTQLSTDYNRLKTANNVLNQDVQDCRKRNMELERSYSQEIENMRAERERSMRTQVIWKQTFSYLMIKIGNGEKSKLRSNFTI